MVFGERGSQENELVQGIGIGLGSVDEGCICMTRISGEAHWGEANLRQ